MKRTNLIVDENLLKEAKRVLGAESYSAAVNAALAEAIKLQKVRSIAEFFGTGIWRGDLPEMREDVSRSSSRRRRA